MSLTTTVRVERPEGTTVASGIPVQIDHASAEELIEFEGARPYDTFMIYTLNVPSVPIRRRDVLFDERNVDVETGVAAKYRVSGHVETFTGSHQELVAERVVGG